MGDRRPFSLTPAYGATSAQPLTSGVFCVFSEAFCVCSLASAGRTGLERKGIFILHLFLAGGLKREHL